MSHDVFSCCCDASTEVCVNPEMEIETGAGVERSLRVVKDK